MNVVTKTRICPEGTDITVITVMYSSLTRCLLYFCKHFHILSHLKWDPEFLTDNLPISDKFTLPFSGQNSKLCDWSLNLDIFPPFLLSKNSRW